MRDFGIDLAFNASHCRFELVKIPVNDFIVYIHLRKVYDLQLAETIPMAAIQFLLILCFLWPSYVCMTK